MKFKSIVASVAFAFAASGAQAAVLTFDGLNGWTDVYNLAPGMSATEFSLSYEEQGFMLTLWTPNTWTYGAHIGDALGNGGTYDWHGDGNNGYGSYVTLTRVGGGAFDLTGFDYRNYNGFMISAGGYADIALTGDGRNAMPYRNVTEVRFSGDSAYTALDNLELTAVDAEVPEPGSAALLLAGLGLIGAAVRRRKA